MPNLSDKILLSKSKQKPKTSSDPSAVLGQIYETLSQNRKEELKLRQKLENFKNERDQEEERRRNKLLELFSPEEADEEKEVEKKVEKKKTKSFLEKLGYNNITGALIDLSIITGVILSTTKDAEATEKKIDSIEDLSIKEQEKDQEIKKEPTVPPVTEEPTPSSKTAPEPTVEPAAAAPTQLEPTPTIVTPPTPEPAVVGQPEVIQPPAVATKTTETQTQASVLTDSSGQPVVDSSGKSITIGEVKDIIEEKRKTPEVVPEVIPKVEPVPIPKAEKIPSKPIAIGGEDAEIKKMIIGHEGSIPYPYKDSLDKWTIGVGHLIGDGKSLPPNLENYKNNKGAFYRGNNRTPALSQEEIKKLFEEDYQKHKKLATKTPGWNLANQMGKAAMIDLNFNMGGVWYKKFPKTSKLLEEGNFAAAAEELKDSNWFSQVPNRSGKIVSMIAAGKEGSNASKDAATVMPTEGTSGNKLYQSSMQNQDMKRETKKGSDAQQTNNVFVQSQTAGKVATGPKEKLDDRPVYLRKSMA